MARRLQNVILAGCPAPLNSVLPVGHAMFFPARVHVEVRPSKALHQALQPSLLILFPSSHNSPASLMPFPHNGFSVEVGGVDGQDRQTGGFNCCEWVVTAKHDKKIIAKREINTSTMV